MPLTDFLFRTTPKNTSGRAFPVQNLSRGLGWTYLGVVVMLVKVKQQLCVCAQVTYGLGVQPGAGTSAGGETAQKLLGERRAAPWVDAEAARAQRRRSETKQGHKKVGTKGRAHMGGAAAREGAWRAGW